MKKIEEMFVESLNDRQYEDKKLLFPLLANDVIGLDNRNLQKSLSYCTKDGLHNDETVRDCSRGF